MSDEKFQKFCKETSINPGMIAIMAFAGILIAAALLGDCLARL
jgi:hypothetical protein